MNHTTTSLMPFDKHDVPAFGQVQGDRFATCSDLEGTAVRCASGDLWVTIENDVADHVLHAGQSLTIPTQGKVIIGGRGRYQLEPGVRMPLAS